MNKFSCYLTLAISPNFFTISVRSFLPAFRKACFLQHESMYCFYLYYYFHMDGKHNSSVPIPWLIYYYTILKKQADSLPNESRIIGGNPVPGGQYPFMVYFLYDFLKIFLLSYGYFLTNIRRDFWSRLQIQVRLSNAEELSSLRTTFLPLPIVYSGKNQSVTNHTDN